MCFLIHLKDTMQGKPTNIPMILSFLYPFRGLKVIPPPPQKKKSYLHFHYETILPYKNFNFCHLLNESISGN